jgi:hypothetical protein
MAQKIDQHEIYRTLIKNYPWLWEAPSQAVSDDEYRRAFKLQNADWFPYMAYYDLSILDELKPYLVSFTGLSPAPGVAYLRSVWQFSRETHSSAIFCKHPHDTERVVTYMDFLSINNKEVLDLYKRFEKFEYQKEEVVYGFQGLMAPRPQVGFNPTEEGVSTGTHRPLIKDKI